MLFLIPLILAACIWHFRRVQLVSVAYYAPARRWWLSRRALRFWLTALAASCACYACGNPSFVYNAQTTAPAVVNLAIVLDMSGSMDASDLPADTRLPQGPASEDLPPSRIAAAKSHIRALLAACPDTRAALLAFARNTILVAPLASAHDVLLDRLETIQTEHFQDGTAIGQAIQAAVRSLKCAPDGPKTIILLSDGVDHESSDSTPAAAAQAAHESGIAIYAIGIGGSNAYHPVNTDDGIRWENVGEPMDMAQLQEIARLAGGDAFQAKDAARLADAIHAIQQTISTQSRNFRSPRRLYLAPFLLLLAAALATTAFALAKIAR